MDPYDTLYDPAMKQAMLQEKNAELIDKLASDNPVLVKEAEADMTDYVRTVLRETAFCDVILPARPVGENTNYVWKTDDEGLYIGDEMEPAVFGAISMPFHGSPPTLTMGGTRFETPIRTIWTPRYEKHVHMLTTYKTELRSVFLDLMLKDLQTEKDVAFMRTVNQIVGPGGVTMNSTGAVQHRIMGTPLNRDSWWESLGYMQQTVLDSGLQASCSLLNAVSVNRFGRMDRSEMGGDVSQEIMLMGFSKKQIAGQNLLVTIKRSLVPDGFVYQFAGPEFLGKSYVHTDTTVFTTQRELMISMAAVWMGGATIANLPGVMLVEFQP